MPYNEQIETRIKKIISRWKNIDQKNMFGGVCHLLNGNMVCGVYKDFLILRLGEENADKALSLPHVKPFDITAVEAEVTTRLPKLLESATVTAALSGVSGATCMRTVSVTASGQYNYGFAYRLLALLGFSINPSALITRTTEMRYEFQSVQYSTPC